MTKKEVRKYYSALRNQLSEEQYEEFNRKIFERFTRVDLSQVKVIHSYLTMREKKEPLTDQILDWLKENYPHITICIPRTDMENNHMDNVIYDETSVLEKNDYGIPEPVDGEHLDAKLIDLAIVPLLGFDALGNRVGYGKGFYDRFLKYCKPGIIKIGLCFFDPIVLVDDTDQFDVPLSHCITPTDYYVF